MKTRVPLRRCLVLITGLLAFLAAPALAQDAGSASGKHMLWKVSSEDGAEGYLVGSVHLMKPDAYPLDAAFDEAFSASDLLAFEVDMDSVQAQAPQLIRKLGVYQEKGQTLEKALAPETYALLESTLDSLGLPARRFQRLEPWVVALTVPVILIQRAGYQPSSGIDAHFFKKARKAGKERVAFETPRYQFEEIFDSLPAEKQEAYLKYSLQEADRTTAMIDEMVAGWKTGDTEALEHILQDEMQERFPELYDRLLLQRNNNWMPQIEKLLGKEKRPMFIVGAGHLVGQDGLLAMLEEQGYRLEQM